MIVIHILKYIFNLLFMIIICETGLKAIIKPFIKRKTNEEDNGFDEDIGKRNWQYVFKILIWILEIIPLMALYVFVFKNIKTMFWLLVIICLPGFLQQFIGVLYSFGIVGNVIKLKEKGSLSSEEKSALSILAFVICFLGEYNFFENIIIFVQKCQNVYISDISVAIGYVFVFYVYIFFICSLFTELISEIIRILIKINSIFPKRINVLNNCKYWISNTDKPIKSVFVTIYMMESMGKYNKFLKWIRIVLFPITFVLDMVINFVNILVSLANSSVGYICIICVLIYGEIKKIANKILILSDRKIVAISFRFALIMALIVIVALNYYSTIFKMEESTTVLEFIASTILIPVLFEWISSIKNNEIKKYNDSKN